MRRIGATDSEEGGGDGSQEGRDGDMDLHAWNGGYVPRPGVDLATANTTKSDVEPSRGIESGSGTGLFPNQGTDP